MRLANRPPGTSVTFADAASGEAILQMASDENGLLLLAFRLYDASGCLVLDSEGLQRYPAGLIVRCPNGALLLAVPRDSREDVRYCLYNRNGALLTKSRARSLSWSFWVTLRTDGPKLKQGGSGIL